MQQNIVFMIKYVKDKQKKKTKKLFKRFSFIVSLNQKSKYNILIQNKSIV